MSFSVARHNMVEGQIRTNKVRHARLIEAMETLPRERFVPTEFWPLAYSDKDCPVGQDRYLIEPLVFARMVEQAHITPDSQILDVGPASGYSTAILAHLARQVMAVEANAVMAAKAKDALAGLRISNAYVVTGDMTQGYAPGAPYDAIFIQGAVDDIPRDLFNQLKESGRLVAVVRSSKGLGVATVYEKRSGVITGLPLFETGVHPLPGFQRDKEFAW